KLIYSFRVSKSHFPRLSLQIFYKMWYSLGSRHPNEPDVA
ncbi:unnamed protein product, partial [marine sediment metagenome]